MRLYWTGKLEERLHKSKKSRLPKNSVQICGKEFKFARICQWDFVSVVFIFQFVIQLAQFQPVELCLKCFDSFMDYDLGILTHAKTIGDCVKRVIK